MRPKPRGLERQYAEQFCDGSVVAAYSTRPPYWDGLIPVILDYSGTPRPHILDRVLIIDGDMRWAAGQASWHVDWRRTSRQSPRSINPSAWSPRAQALNGGDAPNITWIVGRVDCLLSGPFSCALAADGFHWFDWHALWPRLVEWLPSSSLVLVERRELPSPWSDELGSLIAALSTNQDFESYELLAELTSRRILSVEGRTVLGPAAFRQSIGDYITSIHSRNGFSRDRMSAEASRQFDAAVRAAVSPYLTDDTLALSLETRATWGRVLSPE